jgi:hypothetical protein
MNARTATAIVSLEEMESQLQTLQKERVRIEESLDGLRRQKAEKEEEARPLKKLLVTGDKSASARLDRIDAEIRDIARREDSLRADEAQLAPVRRGLRGSGQGHEGISCGVRCCDREGRQDVDVVGHAAGDLGPGGCFRE